MAADGETADPAPGGAPLLAQEAAGEGPSGEEPTRDDGGWATESAEYALRSAEADEDEDEDERTFAAGAESEPARSADEPAATATVGDAETAPAAAGAAGAATTAEVEAGRSGKTRLSKEERAAEKARRRQQAAEEAITGVDEHSAVVVPVIRHLNTVTKELALAYKTIGHLTAERDGFRRQVYQLQGLPLPEEAAATAARAREKEGRAEAKEARLEARAMKQAERTGVDPTLTPEELAAQLQQTARKRRMIAGGVMLVLVFAFILARRVDSGFFEHVGKQGLTVIPFIGPLMSIFLAGFLIYRIARVGSKAKDWLFPSMEQPRKRRR